MKKFLILLVFTFAFPLFSQNIEPTDSVMSQIWDLMSEEEKSVLVKDFLNSELQSVFSIDKAMETANEERYLSGKRKLIVGTVLSTVGLGMTFMPFSFIDNDFDAFLISGVICWSIGAPMFWAGIPITIVGGVQMARYKPTIALAPNGMKFSMEF